MDTDLINNLKKLAYGRSTPYVLVGTHDGSFHADEICAIAVLQEALPADIETRVLRTRDPMFLAKCDIVVDVGGGRYDHHGQDNKHYPNGVPYSALGKVLDDVEPNVQLRNFILWDWGYAIQSYDNGVYHLPPGIEQSKMRWINAMNATWDEHLSQSELQERFEETLKMARKIYRRVRTQAMSRILSQQVLATAPVYIKKFIELPMCGCPWQQVAYKNKNLLGAYHQDEHGHWVVRVAKDNPVCPGTRIDFPAEWGGLEGKALESVTKIKGSLFCHKALYMAIFETKDAAMTAMRFLAELDRLR